MAMDTSTCSENLVSATLAIARLYTSNCYFYVLYNVRKGYLFANWVTYTLKKASCYSHVEHKCVKFWQGTILRYIIMVHVSTIMVGGASRTDTTTTG